MHTNPIKIGPTGIIVVLDVVGHQFDKALK